MMNPPENTVPDALSERLHNQQRKSAMSEWRKRLSQRPETDLNVEAATLLQEERSRRDIEIGWPDS